MVILFYLVGFPRKQTGKNFYFLIFHCKAISMPMGSVATHTFTHQLLTYTELKIRGMRQVLLGLVCCKTVRSSEFGPNIQPTHPHPTHVHTHTYTQNEGQRGPFSEGGPSQPFTVNRTVAFHSWGRYRQRQPYIASRGSCRSLAL